MYLQLFLGDMMDIEKIKTRYRILDSEKITSGFSKDEKIVLTDAFDRKYLLRISDKENLTKKHEQCILLKKLNEKKLPVPQPVQAGMLDDGRCFILLTYLSGSNVAESFEYMKNNDIYETGVQTGRILKEIHSIEIPENEMSWYQKILNKKDKKIEKLLSCTEKIPMQDEILEFYEENTKLMENRPQVYCHSDFHINNFIIDGDKIKIIDFDKCKIADPYDEFKPYCWNVIANEYFETGIIDGYFENNIPDDFFQILKYYTAESMISHLPWAMNFGEREIRIANQINALQLAWWDNLKSDVPKWYKKI